MKQAVALFFLFIFSFQVVPVKALGKLIAKAQMTEEVKQSCDGDCDDTGCPDDDTKDGKDTKDEKEKDEKNENSEKYNDLIHFTKLHTEHSLAVFSPGNKFTLWTSEDLIHLFKKDIHCPPPNC